MASELTSKEMRVLLLPPTRRDADAMCKLLEGTGVACAVCADVPALCAELAGGAGAVIYLRGRSAPPAPLDAAQEAELAALMNSDEAH